MKLDRLVLALALALALASTLGSCGGGSDAPTHANNAFPSEPYRRYVATSMSTYASSTRPGAAVDGIALEVIPWMPTHAHDTSVVPTVTAEGNGRYHVAHVELFMPGTWQPRMTFGENGGADHAVVPVDVQ